MITDASGAIVVVGSNHKVDTYAAAASDDLATITGAEVDGQRLIIRGHVPTVRGIVIKHGTGNILLAGG